MPSGLSLAGRLSVTQSTLADVGVGMVKQVDFDVAEAARSSADNSRSYVYFIQADVNLNEKVGYTASSDENSKDDAYSLGAISVASSSASNVKMALPGNGGVNIDAGLISAVDKTNGDASLGEFPVTLTLALNDQGVMTSSIAITGSNVTGSNAEDPTKAQVAHWSITSVPTVGADTADVLSKDITASQLTSQYASELATINAFYNGVTVVDSWSISINEMASATTNALAQHARFLGRAGRSANLFDAGDKIVAETPFNFAININDYTGKSVAVSSGKVFGVLNHSA